MTLDGVLGAMVEPVTESASSCLRLEALHLVAIRCEPEPHPWALTPWWCSSVHRKRLKRSGPSSQPSSPQPTTRGWSSGSRYLRRTDRIAAASAIRPAALERAAVRNYSTADGLSTTVGELWP